MEDMSAEIKNAAAVADAAAGTGGSGASSVDEAQARSLGILLEEHKAADLVVLDLRQMKTWTDFFIIATASSSTHLDGLDRHVKEFVRDQNMEIIRRSPKPSSQDDEWRILDLGTIVVHLMSVRTRSFYELERLYPPPQATVIYP